MAPLRFGQLTPHARREQDDLVVFDRPQGRTRLFAGSHHELTRPDGKQHRDVGGDVLRGDHIALDDAHPKARVVDAERVQLVGDHRIGSDAQEPHVLEAAWPSAAHVVVVEEGRKDRATLRRGFLALEGPRPRVEPIPLGELAHVRRALPRAALHHVHDGQAGGSRRVSLGDRLGQLARTQPVRTPRPLHDPLEKRVERLGGDRRARGVANPGAAGRPRLDQPVARQRGVGVTHRVDVDPPGRGRLAQWLERVSRSELASADPFADRLGDLVVERNRAGAVDDEP